MQNHTISDLIIDEQQENNNLMVHTNIELLKERLIKIFEKDKIYHNREL